MRLTKQLSNTIRYEMGLTSNICLIFVNFLVFVLSFGIKFHFLCFHPLFNYVIITSVVCFTLGHWNENAESDERKLSLQ